MNKLCDIPLGILVEGAIRINRELVHEKRYAIEWIETVKNCADNFYIDLNKNPDQLAVCINSRHSELGMEIGEAIVSNDMGENIIFSFANDAELFECDEGAIVAKTMVEYKSPKLPNLMIRRRGELLVDIIFSKKFTHAQVQEFLRSACVLKQDGKI